MVNKRDTEIRITSHSTPDQQQSVNETHDEEAMASMQSEFTISNPIILEKIFMKMFCYCGTILHVCSI